MENFPFEISHPSKEGFYEVSRWQSQTGLLDPSEMEDLLQSLPACHLVAVSEVLDKSEALLSVKDFLKIYSEDIEHLKSGKERDESKTRKYFSCNLTLSPTTHYAMEMRGGCLMKARAPVIQLQSHSFSFEREKKRFLTMNFGKNCIPWGIQFSYPQIFRDPKTKAIHQTYSSSAFPNTLLYKEIMRWFRNHTQPVPFLIEGEKKRATFRIGNRALDWAHLHPGLRNNLLEVTV